LIVCGGVRSGLVVVALDGGSVSFAAVPQFFLFFAFDLLRDSRQLDRQRDQHQRDQQHHGEKYVPALAVSSCVRFSRPGRHRGVNGIGCWLLLSMSSIQTSFGWICTTLSRLAPQSS